MHPQPTHHLSHSRQKRTLAGALVRFLSEMWFGGQETLAPTEMRSVISDLHPQFDSRSQQDAQELLLYLLNGLHEDLKNVKRRSLSSFLLKRENGGASATPESSIITLLFEGQLRYVTQGLHCDHQTQSSQVFTMLSLPIPNGSKKCSLQDCLALFFQQNTLTSSNQILCSQCGIKQDTAILTTLDSPPTILILHLKCFECQGKKKKKLKTNVSFSMENLDLSPYVSPSSSKHKTYWLYAVINHSGDLNAGHYTACCRNPLTQRWHNYDDATVSEIPDYLIQSSSAYILLYSCQEIRKPCVPGL
ncbi:UBP50 hydrolase, partial [Amia calva]|nr:UBP50 hydrolase [Amia calva]